MALRVTLSDRTSTDEPSLHAIEAYVEDTAHPGLRATFGYAMGAFTRPLLMRSVTVGPPPQVPIRRQKRLTASGVRDLPFARWEAAARTRIVQEHSLKLDQMLVVLAGGAPSEELDHMRRILEPAANVEALHPGLGHSDTPGDKRRYRGLLHLAEVAHDYQAAVLEGVPDPASEIARNRGVNPTTVRSWIHRARKAKLLPES